MEIEIDISCLDIPDTFFSHIPVEQHVSQLEQLKTFFSTKENYLHLLKK